MLVLNYGSSRIKFAWFDATIAPLPRQPCWHGKVEGITGPAPRYQEAGQRAVTLALDAGDPYAAALLHIRDRLAAHPGDDLLVAVAPRVVPGGRRPFAPVRVDGTGTAPCVAKVVTHVKCWGGAVS